MTECKTPTVYCCTDEGKMHDGTGIKPDIRYYYAKADIDKVIADLIEKNKRLARKDIIMASNAIKEVYKELHHQKYKRCLAMAKWCDEVMMSCELRGYAVHRIWANKHKWAMRWKYRWLELAEKFKEGV